MATGYLYDVWFSNINLNTVSKLVGDAKKPNFNIPVGVSPRGIAVSLDNYTVYMTNSGDNTVSKIYKGEFQKDIIVGKGPRGICIDTDGILWVSNSSDNTVSKIEHDTSPTMDIHVGTSPRGICVDQKKIVYVANFMSRTISMIVNGVKAPKDIDVGINPYGICVNKYGYVYVTNSGSNTVSKIVNGAVVKTIAVGKNPTGICVDKNNAIWVTNSGSNTVSKIEGDLVTKEIKVGISPQGVSVTLDNIIYVSNTGSNNFSKIENDLVTLTIPAGDSPINFGDATGMQAYIIFNGVVIDPGNPGGTPSVITASDIKFDDGQSLQYKLDTGAFKGIKGDKGDPGNGIKTLKVDANSHLVVTLDDGTVIDAGAIIVSGGAAGTADKVTYHNTTYTTVEAALDKLLYVAPSINSFNNNVNVVEIGSTVNSVTLDWSLNKAMISQTIDQGIGTIAVGTTTKTLTALALTSNKSWTLTVSDGTNTTSKSTTISFQNKRYWGTSINESLTDADILALGSEFSTSRVQSRVLNASGGKYLYFAVPTSFGLDASKFKVGGLANSDWVKTTRSFVNASGYAVSYDIFRSGNIQTGSAISVEIV